MKEIPLTQGKVAIVDDEDYPALAQFKWFAVRHGRTFYAVRTPWVLLPSPHSETVRMHRSILGLSSGDSTQVDHINGDGCDNRRGNLRLATNTENARNCGKQSNNKSGYLGVSWHERPRKWRAQLKANGRNLHLGYFDDPVDAARAYDAAARKYFAGFARLNFTD